MDSPKNQTRGGRGSGDVLKFNKDTKLPSDFTENFLKNTTNKNRLSEFLADSFLELYSGEKCFVVTKGDYIMSK